MHFTVNHKENFVNPKTGKHTQLVECLWDVNKRKVPTVFVGHTGRNYLLKYLIFLMKKDMKR